MECINCTQCIDACDTVMDKVGKPRGLIGYRTPGKLLRTRTIVYPALLAIAASLLVWSISTRGVTEVTVGRISGPSFVELPDGTISSAVRLKLENESDETRHYTISIREPDAKLRSPQPRWDVKAHKSIEIPLYVDVPRASFVGGRRRAYLYIDDSGGFHRVVKTTLLGPETTKLVPPSVGP